MSEDRFFERLREEAAGLRYEPENPAAWTRLSARIRDGVLTRSQPVTVAQLLARWFRPVVISLAALAIVSTLGVQWFETSHDTMSVEAAMASNNVEISIDGDIYRVAD